jgi:hypothetical protein
VAATATAPKQNEMILPDPQREADESDAGKFIRPIFSRKKPRAPTMAFSLKECSGSGAIPVFRTG